MNFTINNHNRKFYLSPANSVVYIHALRESRAYLT